MFAFTAEPSWTSDERLNLLASWTPTLDETEESELSGRRRGGLRCPARAGRGDEHEVPPLGLFFDLVFVFRKEKGGGEGSNLRSA
jgi:hypothetical protein